MTLRHLGIPSVSISMGIMADIGMPVNLTFIGPAYTDNDLLSYAYAYEQATHNRRPPTRVPPLADETIDYVPSSVPSSRECTTPPALTLSTQLRADGSDGAVLDITGTVNTAQGPAELRVYVNGRRLTTTATGEQWSASVRTATFTRPRVSSAEHLTVVVSAKDTLGNAAATLTQVPHQRPEQHESPSHTEPDQPESTPPWPSRRVKAERSLHCPSARADH
jgi:amidase